jgi:hypothetical protein
LKTDSTLPLFGGLSWDANFMQDGDMTYELNNKKGAPLGRLLFLNF